MTGSFQSAPTADVAQSLMTVIGAGCVKTVVRGKNKEVDHEISSFDAAF